MQEILCDAVFYFCNSWTCFHISKHVQLNPALRGFTSTLLIRTPHNYGQFSLSLGKENSYIFSNLNPLNTDTFYGPLSTVSVLTGFDCTVKPCIMDTSLIRTPHYYRQFSLSWEKKILTFSKNSTRLKGLCHGSPVHFV